MKKMLLLVTLLTLVAFVSGVMAQQKPAPAPAAPAATAPAKAMEMKIEKFHGAISKVDQMGKMIEVKGKMKKEEKTMTFMINDMTKIMKGKGMMKMEDLKEGMTASVEYMKEGDKMMAATIKLSAPKAAPKKM